MVGVLWLQIERHILLYESKYTNFVYVLCTVFSAILETFKSLRWMYYDIKLKGMYFYMNPNYFEKFLQNITFSEVYSSFLHIDAVIIMLTLATDISKFNTSICLDYFNTYYFYQHRLLTFQNIYFITNSWWCCFQVPTLTLSPFFMVIALPSGW